MKLTIFTPTYNRDDEIRGLYESIIKSYKKMHTADEVEWLIIDDGSTTDIDRVIATFSGQNRFSIRYEKKRNGGKHTAFNKAIEIADSDYFVCIDDDDRLTSNAITDIFALANRFNNGRFGGVVGRAVDTDGKLLGKTFFDEYLVSNTIEIRDKYHFWGEPEVFYTKYLKEYRFLEIENEKFLTEAYVFDRMSEKYPFVYTNIPMMTKKFLKNGLTDNNVSIRIKSPIGTEEYYYQRKAMSKGVGYKLKATVNRRRFARYSSNTPARNIDIYELIAMPIAWLFSIMDRKKAK